MKERVEDSGTRPALGNRVGNERGGSPGQRCERACGRAKEHAERGRLEREPAEGQRQHDGDGEAGAPERVLLEATDGAGDAGLPAHAHEVVAADDTLPVAGPFEEARERDVVADLEPYLLVPADRLVSCSSDEVERADAHAAA